MSEKEFEDFMAKAEQNRNNRDDDINPYDYFKKGEFDIDPVEMNSKDMEIEMLLDRIQEQDQRLIELEASVAQNEEFTIDNTEMEQMDMVDLKDDISALKELAYKNQGKIEIFDESKLTKADLLKIEEDKERLDAIFSQLKLEAGHETAGERVTGEKSDNEFNGAIDSSMALVTTLMSTLVIGFFLGCMCLCCYMKFNKRRGRIPSAMQFEGDEQEPRAHERRIVRQ